MEDIEAKVAALVRSPLGCACLLIADASGLPPYEIARPVISLYMGAMASMRGPSPDRRPGPGYRG